MNSPCFSIRLAVIIFFQGRKIFLVTELLTGGELLDRITSKGYLMESEARPILMSLTKVVQYLHQQGVVHRCAHSSYHRI